MMEIEMIEKLYRIKIVGVPGYHLGVKRCWVAGDCVMKFTNEELVMN